jgi:hypothetical protein
MTSSSYPIGTRVSGRATPPGAAFAYDSRRPNRPAWAHHEPRKPYAHQAERERPRRAEQIADAVLGRGAEQAARAAAWAELLAAREYRDQAPARAAAEATERDASARAQAASVIARLLGNPVEESPDQTETKEN